MSDTRWLFRNQGGGNTDVIDFRAGDTAYWPDNVRDRFKDGDAVKFTTIGAGLTGITAGTTYYVLNVSRQSFRLSANPGGAAITWGGSGKVTGMNPVGGSFPAVFQVTLPTGVVVMDGGHVGGSATEFDTWLAGAGQLIVEKTGTFNNVAMRLHTSETGELRDPTFATSTAAAMRDQWALSGTGGAIALSNDKLKGVQSLIVTKTAAGAQELSLTVPVRLARLLWQFNYKKGAASVIHEAFMISHTGSPRGNSLWTSTLNAAAGSWTTYNQPSRYYQPTPRWAQFVVFTWALGGLAVGESFQIDVPRLSFA
jgi:hypothetical protein